jgi:hypothetical protein
MDEKKIKFISQIGWMLIIIGIMMTIGISGRFATYALEEKYAVWFLEFLFIIPGIILKIWAWKMRKIKA